MISNVLKIHLRMLLRSSLEVAFWHHLASWPPGAPWGPLASSSQIRAVGNLSLNKALAGRGRSTQNRLPPGERNFCCVHSFLSAGMSMEHNQDWAQVRGCSNWTCFMMAIPFEKVSNIWVWVNTYRYIFSGFFTSINPSYFKGFTARYHGLSPHPHFLTSALFFGR